MFYERRIPTIAGIIKEASSMDADGGIRISGRHGGKNCYVFVTRFGQRYTVMVYERRAGKEDGLGKRISAEELEGTIQLRLLLRKLVSPKVDAFAY